LQSYLDLHRDEKFKYGTRDCCLFTAGCIEAMTGIDIAAWFRGRYGTRKQSFALVKERTGKASIQAVIEYVAKEHGFQPIPVAMAQRGDMVLIGKGARAVVGVVSLSGLDAMCLTRNQIVRVALDKATFAWRV
jgi:hypothetical protein